MPNKNHIIEYITRLSVDFANIEDVEFVLRASLQDGNSRALDIDVE